MDGNNKKYHSIHQVKNEKENALGAYKKPLIQLMLEKGYWDLKINHKTKLIIDEDDDEEEVIEDRDVEEEEEKEEEINYDEEIIDDDETEDDLKDLVVMDESEENEIV